MCNEIKESTFCARVSGPPHLLHSLKPCPKGYSKINGYLPSSNVDGKLKRGWITSGG